MLSEYPAADAAADAAAVAATQGPDRQKALGED